MRRHRDAFSDSPIYRSMLDVGGDYAVRMRGEDHVWTAETVSRLQHAVRGNSQDHYRAFAKIVNEQNERLLTIRGLFNICLLYTSPSPRDRQKSRMPSSA